jgi:hypothetical protein
LAWYIGFPNNVLKGSAQFLNQHWVLYSVFGPPLWFKQPDVVGGYIGGIDSSVFTHLGEWKLCMLN